jgi:hypothetical protein
MTMEELLDQYKRDFPNNEKLLEIEKMIKRSIKARDDPKRAQKTTIANFKALDSGSTFLAHCMTKYCIDHVNTTLIVNSLNDIAVRVVHFENEQRVKKLAQKFNGVVVAEN